MSPPTEVGHKNNMYFVNELNVDLHEVKVFPSTADGNVKFESQAGSAAESRPWFYAECRTLREQLNRDIIINNNHRQRGSDCTVLTRPA